MRSPTKRSVADEVLRKMVAAGCDGATAVEAVEIAEGSYNTAYRVRLDRAAGGDEATDEVIVKIAPDATTQTLTYEHDIMRTEARFYELASAHTTAPLPAVLHADFSRTLIDRDYLVLSVVPGELLTTVEVTDAQRRQLRRDLGGVVAGMHAIEGAGFGYLQGRPTPLLPSWREAFVAMVEALLDDAARYGVDLVPDAGTIRSLAAAHSHWLDEITVPVLVHFDLWDGNLFVINSSGAARPRLSGIIDGERAFWGDPHADFVSLALFGDISTDADFLAGYAAGGGRVEPGPSFTRRMTLYRAYLYLLMAIEGYPRQYGSGWAEGFGRLSAQMFQAEMDRLAAPLPD